MNRPERITNKQWKSIQSNWNCLSNIDDFCKEWNDVCSRLNLSGYDLSRITIEAKSKDISLGDGDGE